MERKTTMLLAFLFVALASCTVCFAQESGADKSEMELLRQQLHDLQRQVDEMKKQHAAEIEALKATIEKVRHAPTEGEVVEDDIAALRRLAEEEAEKPSEVEEEETEGVVFKAGGISLQALNPEISVTGDMLGTYTHTDSDIDRGKFTFRNLGIHIESYLDPYTRFKAAVPVDEHEAKIGEAYMTRFGIIDNVNLTLGKFRQQFGVVNRWHKHGLDQIDFPLAVRQIFGEGGLNQTGLSVDWTMPPLGKSSQELTFQLTNGENKRLFGNNSWDTPCMLLHYKHFRDLSKDIYIEGGLTGMLGWTDEWPEYIHDSGGGLWHNRHGRLPTSVFGGDLCLRWEPTERMRYRNVEWRSELYFLDRKLPDPFWGDDDTINAWGAYSYLQTKLSRTWEVGIRADYYEPDCYRYANLPTLSLAPLAYAEHGAYRWQVGPYVTWYQSPFVKFRLEYDHLDGHGMGEPVDMVTLQLIFAVGPHKHERY